MRKVIFLTFFVLLCIFCFSKKVPNTLRLATNFIPFTVDPARADDVTSARIVNLVFDTLVRYNDIKKKIVPSLAKSYEISKNNKIFTFKLRKRIYFGASGMMKASDVKFSFERICWPEMHSNGAELFKLIKGYEQVKKGENKKLTGIKIIDDYTISIELVKPFRNFLYNLILPEASIVSEMEVLGFSDNTGVSMTGTGPFQIESWEEAKSITLKRNNSYFEKFPKIENIVFRKIEKKEDQFEAFKKDEIDVLDPAGLDIEALSKNKKIRKYMKKIPEINTYFLVLSLKNEYLRHKDFRKAINYLVDRAEIYEVDHVNVTPAKQLLPKEIWGYSEDYNVPEYSPDKAFDIVQQFTVTRKPLELVSTTGNRVEKILKVLKKEFALVRVDIKLVEVKEEEFFRRFWNGEGDIFLIGWFADYPDATNFFHFVKLIKHLGYSNEEFNKLYDKLLLATKDDIRLQLIGELSEILKEDMPFVPLYKKNKYIILKPWVKGYKLHPIEFDNRYLKVSIH